MFYKRFLNVEDRISSYTHFTGAVFSILMVVVWLITGIIQKVELKVLVATLVFGLSLIALYSSSSYYHAIAKDNPHHTIFRKLDHSMIYVLIVGTYTPLVIKYYDSATQTLVILWLLALAGIVLKLFWLNAPRWISAGLYLLLGWAVIFMRSMLSLLPFPCLILVTLGGIFYSIGGIIYIAKKPSLSNNWGFHEIFHIFIMLGSLSHILAVTFYVL